jgi:hypothetical protein
MPRTTNKINYEEASSSDEESMVDCGKVVECFQERVEKDETPSEVLSWHRGNRVMGKCLTFFCFF